MLGTVWQHMAVLSLPLLEKILRPIVVYVALVVGLRLAGKRELAQLNPFDLVVLLLLSNIVQNAIIGDDSSVTGGLVGAATLLLVNYLVVRFMYGHSRLERMVEGGEDVIVDRGVVDEQRLRRELITREQLEAAAHRQGFGSLDEVERAVLEPEGAIAFLGKRPAPEEARHRELVGRLEEISRQLAELRGAR